MTEQRNIFSAAGLEIRGFLEQSGYYTNIGYVEKTVPIGPKGDKYAEMVSYQSLYAITCYWAAALYINVYNIQAIRDWRDLWRSLKFPFLSVMQVSGEHYDAIAEAAVKELIDYGINWDNMRAWGQKKVITYAN